MGLYEKFGEPKQKEEEVEDSFSWRESSTSSRLLVVTVADPSGWC